MFIFIGSPRVHIPYQQFGIKQNIRFLYWDSDKLECDIIQGSLTLFHRTANLFTGFDSIVLC